MKNSNKSITDIMDYQADLNISVYLHSGAFTGQDSSLFQPGPIDR